LSKNFSKLARSMLVAVNELGKVVKEPVPPVPERATSSATVTSGSKLELATGAVPCADFSVLAMVVKLPLELTTSAIVALVAFALATTVEKSESLSVTLLATAVLTSDTSVVNRASLPRFKVPAAELVFKVAACVATWAPNLLATALTASARETVPPLAPFTVTAKLVRMVFTWAAAPSAFKASAAFTPVAKGLKLSGSTVKPKAALRSAAVRELFAASSVVKGVTTVAPAGAASMPVNARLVVLSVPPVATILPPEPLKV